MTKTSGFQHWVSYAKGIAILLVVYRHILYGIDRTELEVENYLMVANEIFYSFRMPLFFILSGIFVRKSMAKRNGWQFIKTKISTILYPYIVWCVIQITLQIGLSNYTNSDRTLFDFVYIFIQPRALDQMWFLMALFNTTLIFFFLDGVLKLKNWHLIVISIILHYVSGYVTQFSLIHDPLYFLMFFVLGVVGSKYLLSIENKPKLSSIKYLLLILPFFIGSQIVWIIYGRDLQIFLFALVELVGSYFTIILCFRLEKLGILGFLKRAGDYSLPVYLTHALFGAAIRIVLMKFAGIENVLVLLISGIALSTLAGIILYNLARKYGLMWLFFMPDLKKKSLSNAS